MSKFLFYIAMLIVFIVLLSTLIGLMVQYWYYLVGAVLLVFILKKLIGR